jgi:hypothetical protein
MSHRRHRALKWFPRRGRDTYGRRDIGAGMAISMSGQKGAGKRSTPGRTGWRKTGRTGADDIISNPGTGSATRSATMNTIGTTIAEQKCVPPWPAFAPLNGVNLSARTVIEWTAGNRPRGVRPPSRPPLRSFPPLHSTVDPQRPLAGSQAVHTRAINLRGIAHCMEVA